MFYGGPGDDTIHSGPSNDRIDGALLQNGEFGSSASQRGAFYTPPARNYVSYVGSPPGTTGANITPIEVQELSGGYVLVKGPDEGTDIVRNVGFLKYTTAAGVKTKAVGDHSTDTVQLAETNNWLQTHKVSAQMSAAVKQILHPGFNEAHRWSPEKDGTFKITYSFLSDHDTLPLDYKYPSSVGTFANQYADYDNFRTAVTGIFSSLQKAIPNLRFELETESSSTHPEASALGLTDVGTIRFMGFYDLLDNPKEPALGLANLPSNGASVDGDIFLDAGFAGNRFRPGTEPYFTLLHEIGHALGLDHFTGTKGGLQSVMIKQPDSSLRGFTKVDITALKALYGSSGGPVYEASMDIQANASVSSRWDIAV